MCELTLEDFGFRDDEARVARRIHDMLQQPQDPVAPLPPWVSRRAPWAGCVVPAFPAAATGDTRRSQP